MTHIDVQQAIKRFQYKPNVEVEICDYDSHYNDPPHIRVTMWVLDSRQEYPCSSEESRRALSLAMYGATGCVHIPDGGMWSFQPRKVTQIAYVPAMAMEDDEKYFWLWLRTVIRSIEDHEIDEWFRVDGELYNDPHKLSAGTTTKSVVFP
jgi:hypothetical protein